MNGGLGLSPTMLGVVTTLPTAAFAAFGAITPRLTRRFGATKLLLAAMALLALGQAARALTPSTGVFLVSSAAALAGIAVANILMPVLVRRYFLSRLGMVTGLYTTVMIAGSTVAAAASVPIAQASGSWRVGIGVWALLAAVAVVPVLALWRTGETPQATRGPGAPGAPGAAAPIRVSRTRLGWALALFFGFQSFSAYAIMGWLPQIYRDAGFSAGASGLLLAGVMAGSIPMALAMPALAARRPDQRPLVLILAGTMLAAYLGLAIAPHGGALIWTALLAVGQGAFPLALTLIGMRARTSAGSVGLSAFAQSTGYLIAMAGPLAVGVLYEATGGWVASMGVLLVALVIQATAGLAAARPRALEDETGTAPASRRSTELSASTQV